MEYFGKEYFMKINIKKYRYIYVAMIDFIPKGNDEIDINIQINGKEIDINKFINEVDKNICEGAYYQ